MQKPNLNYFRNWYQDRSQNILSDFFKFLSFPSISTDPAYQKDVQETAQWLASYYKDSGMDVEIWDTIGHPVIFASNLSAGTGRPTVLIYNHYDVQPVDPLDKWTSPPFEPTLKGEEVFARGASDNKGQAFYCALAIRSFIESCKSLNVNVKVFIEGEEECGSRGSCAILKEKKEALKADYLLIVDLGIPEKNSPAITLGLRGIVAMEVECKNASTDLHSGMHGGVVVNPNRALVDVLSKLWDKDGRVAVKGFYDHINPLKEEELSIFNRTLNTKTWSEKFGVKAFHNIPGHTLWDLNTICPTVEINGISGGYTGEGFKTVIPSSSHAKISCRLVPGQDSNEIARLISEFLKANVAQGIEIKTSWDHTADAVRSSSKSKIARIAAKAYEDVFGKTCEKRLSGGSVPLVPALADASGAEVALIGVALDEDNIHAPNERFSLERLQLGFLTICQILTLLSED